MKESETDLHQLMNVFVGLAQATRCLRQDSAFCGGVTFQQYVILDAAAQNKDMRLGDLHGLLGVEKSTTTRLLNPLIAKGFLIKESDASDCRIKRLVLTAKGLKKHQEVKTCLVDFLNKIMGNLPLQGRDETLQAVRTFIDAIRNASGVCNCCR